MQNILSQKILPLKKKKSTEKLGEEKPKHDIDSLLDDLKRDAEKTKKDDN